MMSAASTTQMAPPSATEEEMRAALLSVYHHSIGRRFEIRGAPAVALPPQAQPQSLGDALEKLRGSTARRRQAMWTIARAVGPQRGRELRRGDARLPRYTPELVDVLTATERESLKRFDARRGRYRREAHLFGAALVAYAEGQGATDKFEAILELFKQVAEPPPNLTEDEADRRGNFIDGVAKTGILGDAKEGAPGSERRDGRLGQSAVDFLTGWRDHEDPAAAARSLSRLEEEIGLSLPTFIEEFADSVAFAECFPPAKRDVLTVFPTSSITVQDTQSLTTRVTVTALVNTENFHCLQIGMDPQCWTACSSAFSTAGYLADPFKVDPPDPGPAPGFYEWPGPGPKLLEEEVTIRFGDDASRIAYFNNILNVEFNPDPDTQRIDLDFSLHRCIRSRILWDERAGGILIDEGYARARPLGKHAWRLTVRKTLRFSDRTPYSGGPGWNDFGQLLNYLAPAMLSWWIESEMYSSTCKDILDQAKARAAMEPNPNGPAPPPAEEGDTL
jgi:hypothetical protein